MTMMMIVLATMATLAFTLPRLSAHAAPPPAVSAASASLLGGPTEAPTAVEESQSASAQLEPTAIQLSPAELGLATTPIPPGQAAPRIAIQPAGGNPSLDEFIARVSDGTSEVRGVFAPGILSMRVVEQPNGDFLYIDPDAEAATEYSLASDAGSLGLIAHNYSGGAAFHNLEIGQEITLVTGDGQIQRFEVAVINTYQAMSPEDPYSLFIDLATGVQMDSSSVFAANYLEEGTLVLQTCIEKDGEWSWGRLFVIARPL